MSMEQWFDGLNAKHAEEVIAGKHDAECEWRDNGHFLCNCPARKRKASGYTEPPGELIHQYPLCPRCDNEVDHDGDSFRCYPCSAVWLSDTGPAEFYDDHGDLDMADWDARKAAKP